MVWRKPIRLEHLCPVLPNSFVAWISLCASDFQTAHAEAANAPAFGVVVRLFGIVGRDGVSLALPDHTRCSLEAGSWNLPRVASDFGTSAGCRMSFPDPFDHWTVAAGLAESHSTRFSLSALRLVKRRLSTRTVELSVLGGTVAPAAHAGVVLVRGVRVVFVSLWRVCVDVAALFPKGRKAFGSTR